ncbi:MAG TPA: radical SAM protein [Clostridia bacterium]|nr:radical SAM protein [Clostridia bacterium]
MSKYNLESGVWELTLKCNMNCIHCGSKAGKARENELTLDECLNIAQQYIQLGGKSLTLIGGEIFLCNGWEKIARKLSDGGVAVNIITNAFLLGDKQIEQIKYAKLSNVGISMDGMEESHNKIRNVSTSFQKVLNAFDLLNKENIPIAVVTTLVDFNFGDLEDMYNLLVKNNVKVWQIQIATPMGNMREKTDFLLDPAKVPLITGFIRKKRHEMKMSIYAGDDIGYFDENEMYIRNAPGTIGAWSGCQAGLRVIGIDSVGNVKGCESLYSDVFIEGNLREESLETIWNKEGNFSYNRQFDISKLTGKCLGCDKAKICRGGCRGSCFFTSDMLYENAYCDYAGKKAPEPLGIR